MSLGEDKSRTEYSVHLAGGQPGSGGGEGGGEEDLEQDVNGEPPHGDRDPQDCASPSHRPAEGLPGTHGRSWEVR